MTPERRDFLLSLEAGDVVRINGKLRVVRRVHRYQKKYYPPNVSFWFSILRCSWTNRAYTVKKASDLAHCQIDLVLRNYHPKTDLEKTLESEINLPSPGYNKAITCCDVVGVIS